VESRTGTDLFAALFCSQAMGQDPRVSWRITLPGVPPSWNHAYEFGKRERTDGFGRVKLNSRGEAITYRAVFKKPEVQLYQDRAALIIASARPPGWRWNGGLMYVDFYAYLMRDIDCTNIQKIIEDALARTIGVNDRFFLPRWQHKEIGCSMRTARVEIVVDASA
jgi:hypothetical protein